MNNTKNLQYGFEFPTDIFPDGLNEIINHYYEVLSIQKSYIAASVLYAVSVASGNKYQSNFSGHDVIPSLMITIVGEVSMKKTPAISKMIKPLYDIERENHKLFKSKLAAAKKLNKNSDGDEVIDEPVCKRLLLNDFTTESLVKILEENPDGVGVYSDELKQWINNFNRYSKGSDNQFWLSLFSNTAISNDRKGDIPRRIENPFVSVIGGIQPDVLKSIKGKEEDGFIQRILYVLNDTQERGFWSINKKIDNEIYNNYSNLINSIYLGNGLYEFDENSTDKLIYWQTKKVNRDLFFVDYAYLGKLEIYILRIALLLQIIWDYYEPDGDGSNTIKAETIERAEKLITYFAKTYSKCVMLIEDGENKSIDFLDKNTKEWYDSLEDEVTTKYAISIGGDYGLSKSKVNRLLQNEKLFVKLRHGEYRKFNHEDYNIENEEIEFRFGNDELDEVVEMFIGNYEELYSKMTKIQLKALKSKIDKAREEYNDEYIFERIDRAIQYGNKTFYMEDKEW